MTKPGCSGYCLSHQLLFFLSARMVSAPRGPATDTEERERHKGACGSVVFMLHTRKISGFLGLRFGHPEGEVRVACHLSAIALNQTRENLGF